MPVVYMHFLLYSTYKVELPEALGPLVTEVGGRYFFFSLLLLLRGGRISAIYIHYRYIFVVC
jgi:hypothetical protein